MKPITKALLRVYPRAWRNRYGAEFDALLGDVRPRPRDVVDVLFGALREHARVFLRRPAWQIIAAFAIAGAFSGAVAVRFMPKLYESSATVRIAAKPMYEPADALAASFRSDILLRIAKTRGLYGGADIAEEHRLERMKEDVRVSSRGPDRDVFTVGFVGLDREVTRVVAADLVSSMSEAARSLGISFAVIDPPSATAISPKVPNLMAVGGVIGLLVGCIVAAAVRFRPRPVSLVGSI